MPKPSFLDGPFGYHAESGIYDVTDVITRIGVLLIAAGWTDITSDPNKPAYRCPPVGGSLGKKFDVEFQRYSAAAINLQVYDTLGRASGVRSMLISTTGVGSAMHYFYGPKHIVVACQTTDEVLFAAMLDPYPQAEDANIYGGQVMNGSRAVNGGTASYSPPTYIGMRAANDPSAIFSLSTNFVLWASRPLRTIKMDYMFWPYEFGYMTWWGGRFPHALICVPTTDLPRFMSFQAPLGDGTNGTFKPIIGGSSWQVALRVS